MWFLNHLCWMKDGLSKVTPRLRVAFWETSSCTEGGLSSYSEYRLVLTLWTKGSSWILVWIDSWLLPMPELTKEFWCLIVSSMAKLSLNSFIAWNKTLFVERSTDDYRISLASSLNSSISEFSVSENEILCVVNVCSRTLSGSSLP